MQNAERLQNLLDVAPKERLLVATHRCSGKSMWIAKHAVMSAAMNPGQTVAIYTVSNKSAYFMFDIIEHIIQDLGIADGLTWRQRQPKHFGFSSGSRILINPDPCGLSADTLVFDDITEEQQKLEYLIYNVKNTIILFTPELKTPAWALKLWWDDPSWTKINLPMCTVAEEDQAMLARYREMWGNDEAETAWLAKVPNPEAKKLFCDSLAQAIEQTIEFLKEGLNQIEIYEEKQDKS